MKQQEISRDHITSNSENLEVLTCLPDSLAASCQLRGGGASRVDLRTLGKTGFAAKVAA